MRFPASLFASLGLAAAMVSATSPAAAAEPAKVCPPKDSFVCKFTDGSNKGKQVIAFLHPKKHDVKNGAVYGMMGKLDVDGSIDSVQSQDSMVIYETEGHEFKRTLRFAHIPQINEQTRYPRRHAEFRSRNLLLRRIPA